MTDILAGLNPAQQRAVQAVDGPVLVLAGPGSGKTGVLVRRVAHLVGTVGIDPYRILAVTFTNKAAREMRERLDGLLGVGEVAALTVGTFHSLCARFLRRDIMHLGRERDFVIYDSDDQERLMRRIVRELNLDEKKNPPRAILGAISSAKNELVGPQEFARLNRTYFHEIAARCYERYQALLRESNALDFDDLLVEMVRLFELHPAVLEHYHNRYHYLLVDEYQDTNRAQYILTRQLAAGRRNIFAVGDEDQSIFQWRGADTRNILQFEEDFPDAQVILLEQNYRSTQAVLDVAQAVINGANKRKHVKRLWTQNPGGVQVSLQEGYDQNEEAISVADEINRLRAAGEYGLGDVAILYRTNAQSRAIEESLRARGMPYQIIGGTRFYERKEIKDLVAYLRLAHNPYDSVALTRVLNWPARGIGARSEEELVNWAASLGVPLYQALRELETDAVKAPFNTRTRSALLGFLAQLDDFGTARSQVALPDLFDLALARLDFREALIREYGADEGEDRWTNVLELRNVSLEYVNLPTESQLATFLEEVALVSDIDNVGRQGDVVTCITLHQAKGLEYPVVFIIGLEEGLLPHSRSLDDREKVEEERRLLYVGVTRARERLYLHYAFRRTTYGRTNISTPSRFLADIPKELLKQPKKRGTTTAAPQASMFTDRSGYGGSRYGRGGEQRAGTSSATWGSDARGPAGNRPPKPATPSAVSFFAGQRVRHATFGEGVVVSSRLVDGDEEVTVSFSDRERRLLASFARLERIEG